MTTSEAIDEVRNEIFQELLQTQFACSALTRLSGGISNFVYRGKLTSTDKTIIIKHAKAYLASNASFELDITRCAHETTTLQALDSLPPYFLNNIMVKTPRLFCFDPKSCTQVLEDLPNSLDLKSFLISEASDSLSKNFALSIGHALGSWLRSLHNWSAEKEQATLAKKLGENQSMQQIKFYANYTLLIESIENFPMLLEESRSIFKKVHDLAALELKNQEQSEEYGIIHGDFWTGNVILEPDSLATKSTTDLFIVDWEMSHIGARALDLGQMIAELYQIKLFKDVESGIWIIEGFMKGYGPLSDTMALRTAIHVGVHLICWGSRVPGWGCQELIEKVVKVGRDIIVRAWKKDKEWLEKGSLGCLFATRR